MKTANNPILLTGSTCHASCLRTWRASSDPDADRRRSATQEKEIGKMNEQTEELYDACAEGDPDRVKESLTRGGDVNSNEFDSGFTPLHVCVSGIHRQEARQEVIQLLHRAGAKLDIRDAEKGLTPLHYTALRNKPLCAKALIECGADVHAIEANGATALHGAAYHGNLEVARVLLEGGANPTLEDRRGNTPMSLARMRGHTRLTELLSAGRDDFETPS